MYLWIHKQTLLNITYHIVIIFSLQYTCYDVLYKQLSSWIIHGLLKDDYKKFFIEPVHSIESKEEEENVEIVREKECMCVCVCVCVYQPRELSSVLVNPSLLPSYLSMTVLEVS